MKNIKVLAGSLAALTAGATMALGIFAAPITTLGDYVRTSGNTLNSPMIVITDTNINAQYPNDVVGAADIAAAVAGYATQTVSTGAVGMSVSGGAEIASTNTKLYLADPLTKSGVKTTLTRTDLPTLLGSGTLTDTAGTTYTYDQYITMGGGTAIKFDNSGGDLTDPELILNLSSSSASPVFNYSVTFNKLLNISSANVQNKKLNLLGVDYTIGATSAFDGTTSKLVLYGSSLVQTMAGGEEKQVTVDNTPYTVKVLGASSSTVAIVSVNGDTYSLTKGSSTTVGGLPVYLEDVFYLSSTDNTQNSAKLSFGTNKITLEHGSTVKKGNGDDTVDGTLVKLTGTASSGISKIEIGMAAKDSSTDYVKNGASFTDPVFGAFKMALGGLTGGSTEKVTIDNSGTTAATLRFTDYRGSEKSLTFAYTGSTTFGADLNSSSTSTYVVVEGNTVKKNDYVLVSPSIESEFSHVMQYTTASSLGASGAYIELKDVMSDSTSRYYLTLAGYVTGNFYIDGQQYYTNVVSQTDQSFKFTWDSTATVNSTGTKVTVFPLVKTSKGAWITLVPGHRSVTWAATYSTAAGNTTFELPGGAGSATTISVQNNGVDKVVMCGGTDDRATSNSSGVACTDGRMTWNITMKSGATSNATYFEISNTSTQVANVEYPAVVFKEEKTKNLADADVQDFVIVTVGDGSGSGVDTSVSVPTLSAASQYSGSLQSDNSVTNYIDRRGTTVKYDSDSQGLVEITYPDEQAVASVAVGANPAFGAGAAGTVQAAVKITSPVAKFASEVSSTAPGSDLILLGGPCVNTIVASLLAPSGVTCSNWNYTTGIIKEVTGGFSDGSRALIVAGSNGPSTRSLARMVIQGTLSYAA
jgi:hypothetical protein